MSGTRPLPPLRRLIPLGLLPIAWGDSLLRPAVRILMYHRVTRLGRYDQLTVTPERFEEQIATLLEHCRVVDLRQAVTELEAGGPRRSAVVVTFDDGYRDNLEHALPILNRYRVPVTIFVTARFCDGSQRHPRYPNEPGRLHLSWSELASMAAEPGICIGSHSLTHPYLTRIDDPQAAAEIVGSRQEIAERTGRAVEFFCYPSGDFGERERRLVAGAGYRAAVSVTPGANRGIGRRFALRRTEVTDRDGPRELRLKLLGAYDLPHLLLDWRRRRDFGRARGSRPPA